MRHAAAFLACFGVLALAVTAAAQDDQALIEQVAAERQPVNPVAAEDASSTSVVRDEEVQARVDVALAQARLELVLARKSLRAREFDAAAAHAVRAQDLLRELPTDIDADEYELQAEGVLSRAERAGVKLADVRSMAVDAEPRRRFTRADRQLRDQASVHGQYSDDAVRLLTDVDRSRLAPDGDVAYPNDWPDKAAKRAKFAGGQIARSDSWVDEEGREWYAAVYDVQDLIYVPPDFQPTATLDLAENYRNAMDRHALRWRSGLFSSFYGGDFWDAIPMLRYFGGVDDFAFRGPKYSRERQRQIAETIKAFTTPANEARIIMLEPTP